MPDLLADLEDAQSWVDGVVGAWSLETGLRQERVPLREADLDRLRDLRVDLNTLVGHGDQSHGGPILPSSSVSARLAPDGRVVLEPRGEGSRRVGAMVLIEMFTAQSLDTWRRLKVCRNDRCGVSFYDRSRNNSGVWHDARVCGNAINLRASRARKRERELGVAQPARQAVESGDHS
ncbi:CGNR zinc finger domain-containing protein [Streptomyces sp. NPDC051954]|uniref:CGNR zinc finger domain-containing protein n=1 Tax=Streptomyces sp. NPDC051954 TaxID=3155524 RepID=UPI0034354AAB